jgi:hypothetical protein
MTMQPSDYLVIANKIFTVIAEAFEEMDKREAMRASCVAASELTDELVHLRIRVATLETVQARHDAINDMDGDRLAALETAMNDQRAIRDSIISTLKSLSNRMDSLSQRLDSHDNRMDSLSQRLDSHDKRMDMLERGAATSQPSAIQFQVCKEPDAEWQPPAASVTAVRAILAAMRSLHLRGVQSEDARQWFLSGHWKRTRQRANFRDARRQLLTTPAWEGTAPMALRLVEERWSDLWIHVQADASQAN